MKTETVSTLDAQKVPKHFHSQSETIFLTLENSLPRCLLSYHIQARLHPYKGVVILCCAPADLRDFKKSDKLHRDVLQNKQTSEVLPHLKDAHPVPGIRLEGSVEGVAAGDVG